MRVRLGIVSVLWAAVLCAEPRIVFMKSFPGSVPAWVEIALERDGKAVYKEAPDDPQPLPFQIRKDEVDQVFALADKMEHFKRPLESGLPVAKMGEKTFRWEDGAAKQEVKYNYSQDLDAQALQQWFEKMTETEQHFIAVERAVKFDKLGTNKALLRMQAAMERDRLVGLEQFLPLLERVTKNASYLHMDQERAATLIDWIKNGKPQPAQ
ncbi:MAG: hypothetical protein R2762_02625 [Bryobacteraceae bacterium]